MRIFLPAPITYSEVRRTISLLRGAKTPVEGSASVTAALRADRA